MAYLDRVVRISKENYDILKEGGEVNGHVFDPNAIYLVATDDTEAAGTLDILDHYIDTTKNLAYVVDTIDLNNSVFTLDKELLYQIRITKNMPLHNLNGTLNYTYSGTLNLLLLYTPTVSVQTNDFINSTASDPLFKGKYAGFNTVPSPKYLFVYVITEEDGKLVGKLIQKWNTHTDGSDLPNKYLEIINGVNYKRLYNKLRRLNNKTYVHDRTIEYATSLHNIIRCGSRVFIDRNLPNNNKQIFKFTYLEKPIKRYDEKIFLVDGEDGEYTLVRFDTTMISVFNLIFQQTTQTDAKILITSERIPYKSFTLLDKLIYNNFYDNDVNYTVIDVLLLLNNPNMQFKIVNTGHMHMYIPINFLLGHMRDLLGGRAIYNKPMLPYLFLDESPEGSVRRARHGFISSGVNLGVLVIKEHGLNVNVLRHNMIFDQKASDFNVNITHRFNNNPTDFTNSMNQLRGNFNDINAFIGILANVHNFLSYVYDNACDSTGNKAACLGFPAPPHFDNLNHDLIVRRKGYTWKPFVTNTKCTRFMNGIVYEANTYSEYQMARNEIDNYANTTMLEEIIKRRLLYIFIVRGRTFNGLLRQSCLGRWHNCNETKYLNIAIFPRKTYHHYSHMSHEGVLFTLSLQLMPTLNFRQMSWDELWEYIQGCSYLKYKGKILNPFKCDK